MYFYSNIFAELAARVRAGDHEAREQFKQELTNVMTVMVRQALHDGQGTTPIARRILATARRLQTADGNVRDDPDFVREVAHEMCDETVARLWPGPSGWTPGDSMSHAGHQTTLLAP